MQTSISFADDTPTKKENMCLSLILQVKVQTGHKSHLLTSHAHRTASNARSRSQDYNRVWIGSHIRSDGRAYQKRYSFGHVSMLTMR